MPFSFATAAGAVSISALISLIYGTYLKALVSAGIARFTADPDVQANLQRLAIAAVGAVVGVAAYLLTAAHPGLHDAILAALAGAGEGVGAATGYQTISAVAPAVKAAVTRGPAAAPAPTTAPAVPSPAAPVQDMTTEPPAVV